MKMKFRTGAKLAPVIAVIMTVLFIGAAIIAVMSSVALKRAEEDIRGASAAASEQLESQKAAAASELLVMKTDLDKLESDRLELEGKIAAAEKEREELIRGFENEDERYRTLSEQLRQLNSQLDEKQAEITALEANISELEKVYNVDMNAQFELISRLNALLESGAPLRRVIIPKDEYVPVTEPPETDENGEIVTEPPETDEKGNVIVHETDENGEIVTEPPETDENGEIVTEPPETDENGEIIIPETDENGNIIDPDAPETDENGDYVTYVYPKIGLYYEDIERGYVFAYNADTAFDSASCLKAPFVLSILERASEELAELRRLAEETADTADNISDDSGSGLPADSMTEEPFPTDESGFPVTEPPVTVLLPETDETGEQLSLLLPPGTALKYDFSKILTYTEKLEKPGSGIIKDSEDGTEYTYLELIRYLLVYSDNVAYATLKKEYGVTDFSALAARLKTKVLRYNLTKMSPADGGKVMKEIYSFFQSDAVYAPYMEKCMQGAIHPVTVSYAVYPKKCAHKYGWDVDSYNDIAIVYDKHPYVVTFFSDMDTGGDDVNQYIRSVISLIDELHENFYGR